MSKLNKRCLALAVATALVLPVTAMAATAGYPANTNNTFASNLFGAPTSSVTNPAAYTITTVDTDNIIGRTTGFGVRLILGNGARFANTTTAPTAGAALVNYNAPAIAAPIPAGGSPNLVISVNAAANANITTGALLTWAAGSLDLINLGALSSGGSVPVTIELFDSNTATVFQTISGAALVSAVEGTTVVINPQNGDTLKRIDVGSCLSPAVGPKYRFSPSGAIGASCGAADTDRLEFNAGSITVGIAQVGGNYVRADGFAGPNNYGIFGYVANDAIIVTVSGADFSAFNAATGNDRVYLSPSASCDIAGAIPNAANSRIITGGNSITFETAIVPEWPSIVGTTNYVCFSTSTALAAQIVPQDLEATVQIDFDDANVIDPANRAGPLLPLKYNGTVLEFQNVNPASNPRAQSFVRLTNNGSIVCPITLTAKDDTGVAGDSAIKLNLAVNNSVTFNSEDLEIGSSKGTGSFGDGVGRWYVTADGECANLVGSALNRNLEDGTITNLTPDKR